MRAIKSKAFWVALWRHWLESIAFLWLVYEPFALFMQKSVPHTILAYLCLLITGLVIAIPWAWPKGVVSATIPAQNVHVTVKRGNIFDAKDNVIIGVNDVFDTEIGDIISNRSVQAQLIANRFGGNVREFDRQITDRLDGVHGTVDPTKTKGKNLRYPIGTTVLIDTHGIKHYLCAYCTMSADLKAHTNVLWLITSLEKCWTAIRNTGENRQISMPVLGTDFGRMGLTQTQVVQILVLSFVAANRSQPLAPGLTIYVPSKNAGHIDMVALRLWIKGVLWA